MARLEERVRKLETDSAHVDLESMTDEELMAHAGEHWEAPPWGSRKTMAAMLTLVSRKPSAFPVVPDHLLPPDEEDHP